MREADVQGSLGKVSAASLEKKALGLLMAFEAAGKSVTRVVVDGRRIELELSTGENVDEFDRVDMRHGKA